MSKSLLVVGGAGVLGSFWLNEGSSVIKRFKSVYNCVNISPHASSLAHQNVVLSGDGILSKSAVEDVKKHAEKYHNRYDAVICTAGGFNGRRFNSLGLKFEDPAFFEAYNQMMRMNVDSSLLSTTWLLGSYLALHLLKHQGTLVLTGARGVYKAPSPDIMSYALSKNMVHSIAYSLAKSSHFQEKASLITILP